MVRTLHSAGLEVILDVVFNHTAEGDQWGPTLCFRGIDNAAYYRLQDDRSRYVDDTGCGNTVNVVQQQALRLVLDALRYWVRRCTWTGSASTWPPVSVAGPPTSIRRLPSWRRSARIPFSPG